MQTAASRRPSPGLVQGAAKGALQQVRRYGCPDARLYLFASRAAQILCNSRRQTLGPMGRWQQSRFLINRRTFQKRALLKWEATDRWPGRPGVCWERPEPLSWRSRGGGLQWGQGPELREHLPCSTQSSVDSGLLHDTL